MKKITLFAFMLSVSAGFSQALPLDFESTSLTYTFGDFAGAETVKVANPHIEGINTSANVAKTTRGPGDIYAGSFLDLAAPMDLTTYNTFRMKVWSPNAGIDVKFKIESIPATHYTEVDVINTVANGWEELSFTFPGIVSAHNYQRVVVIFNYGFNGTGQQYYFDDITLGPALATDSFTAATPFKLFPNPATNVLNIIAKESIDKVSIFNTLGQEVLSRNPNSENASIEVGSLQSGIYVVKTITNGQSSVSRFVKK